MDVSLVVLSRSGRRREIGLKSGVTLIGRRPDCDLRIPLMQVSRKHCRILRESEKTVIQDLGSVNGTYLTSVRVMDAVINAGDKLSIGTVEFTVQIDGEPKDISLAEQSAPPRESVPLDQEQLPVLETDPIGADFDEADPLGQRDDAL